MKRKTIGKKFFDGHVDITDPCYNRDVWCRMNQICIQEGWYTCIAWYHSERILFEKKQFFSRRVGILGIYLNGVIPLQKSMEEIGAIGVDAGLAGFFHNKPDYDDEQWAKICSQISQGDVWLNDDGFFSASGYGDGCYGVYAQKVNKQIVALEIRFI